MMHEGLAYLLFFIVVCGGLGAVTLAMLFVALALLRNNVSSRRQ